MHTRLGLLVSALAFTAACSSSPNGTSVNTGDDRSQAHAKSGEAVSASSGLAKVKEVVIPAGTTLSLTLETEVSSDLSRPEDQVRATLAKPIVVDGMTVVKAGAEATGSVLDTKQSGRVKGLASVSFRFDRLRAEDE